MATEAEDKAAAEKAAAHAPTEVGNTGKNPHTFTLHHAGPGGTNHKVTLKPGETGMVSYGYAKPRKEADDYRPALPSIIEDMTNGEVVATSSAKWAEYQAAQQAEAKPKKTRE